MQAAVQSASTAPIRTSAAPPTPLGDSIRKSDRSARIPLPSSRSAAAARKQSPARAASRRQWERASRAGIQFPLSRSSRTITVPPSAGAPIIPLRSKVPRTVRSPSEKRSAASAKDRPSSMIPPFSQAFR